jgi:hypothetical protein
MGTKIVAMALKAAFWDGKAQAVCSIDAGGQMD